MRITLSIFAVLLVLSFAIAPASATWDGSVDTDWYDDHIGDDPYTISNEAQLAGLAKLVNEGTNFKDKTINLGNNLNLGGHQWTPIGTSANKFNGKFYGGSCTISGLYIDNDNANYQGLFGYTDTGAEIKDLGLTGVMVKGYQRVGGLVGQNSGTIDNCDVIGSVFGNNGDIYIHNADPNGIKYSASECGGLVGYNSGTITKSSAAVTVIGTAHYVGGLAGQNYQGIIEECYAVGDVTCVMNNVGGLAGKNWGGTITKCYATGNVNGVDEAGGLVGYNDREINNCYATGTVTGTGNYVGGLVGNSRFVNANIEKCYATGAVNGKSIVGGLVGNMDTTVKEAGYIKNSVALNPQVLATGTNPNIGRVVGIGEIHLTDNYAFNDMLVNGNTVTGGADNNKNGLNKSLDQLTAERTYKTDLGWDFTDTWIMKEDVSSLGITYEYPILKCQIKKVTFDSNGGTPVDFKNVMAGTAVAEPSAPSTPPYSGYTFVGWCTDSALTTVYNFEAPVTKDITLYAKWKYEIGLNNDGTGLAEKYIAAYKSNTLTKSEGFNYPEKAGYTLNGWCTDPSLGTKLINKDESGDTLIGDVTDYTDGGRNWIRSEATATLYANWTAKEYTITLNDGTTPLTGTYTATYGSSDLAKSEGFNYPEKTGYTLNGWFTDSSLGTKLINIGSSDTLIDNVAGYTDANGKWTKDDGAAVYAKWTANTSTVNLDSQSGTGGSTPIIATYDQFCPSFTAPTRTGYTLSGWFTESTGGSKVINSDKSFVSEEVPGWVTGGRWTNTHSTAKLYAQWNQDEYIIQFNVNGGLPQPSDQTKHYDEGVDNPVEVTKTGYTLDGWYNGTAKWNFDSDKVKSAITLTANWTANTYQVTFDSKGGSTPGTKSVTYGSAYGTLPTSTRTGYNFDGWFTAETGGTLVDSETTVNIAESHTLYAHWTAIEYDVEFNGNGKTGGTMANQKIAYNSSANLNTNAYTRTGYSFNGWSPNADGSGTTYADEAEYRMDTEGIVLYAKWTANTYTVTFNVNGGSPQPDQQTKTYGEKLGTPTPVPSKEKSTLEGWYNESACTNKWDFENSIVTDNLILYAKWMPEFYQYFSGGSGTADDQYKISTASDLKNLSTLSRTNHSILGENFIITQNIDLSGNWIPIGDETHPFTGTLNGAGNTISGLTSADAGNRFGLIDTNGGTVKDLIVTAGEIRSSSSNAVIGIIAGTNTGTIQGSSAVIDGAVSAGEGSKLGGLTGENSGTIQNSNVDLKNSITGGAGSTVGGLAGTNTNTGTIKENSKVESTASTHEIKGNGAGSTAGGLVGQNSGIIENAGVNNIKVTISGGTGKAGGLVGQNTGKIEGSTVTSGEIKNTDGKNNNMGGLVGQNSGTSTNGVTGSGADNTVIESKGDENNLGGLIGENTGKIADSTVTSGEIKNTDGKNNNMGGSVGANTNTGTETGLIITDSSVTSSGDSNNIGGNTGKNDGTKTDCSVTDTTVTSSGDHNNIGGNTGVNTGTDTRGNTKGGTVKSTNGNDNDIGGSTGENSGTNTDSKVENTAVNGGNGNSNDVSGHTAENDNNGKITNPEVKGETITPATGEGNKVGTLTAENRGEVITPTPTPDPKPTSHSGGSTDTGTGHYTNYERTTTNGGLVSFGTSPYVVSVELPDGTIGKVALNLGTDLDWIKDESSVYTFDLEVANKADGTAKINFKLSKDKLDKLGIDYSDVSMYHEEDGEWVKLKTEFTVSENGYIYYTSYTESFSPFKILFEEGGSESVEKDLTAIQEAEKQTGEPQTSETPTSAVPADPSSTAQPSAQPTASPMGAAGLIAGLITALIAVRRNRQ